MPKWLSIGLLIWIQWLLLVVNTKAIAETSYTWTVVSDVAIAFFGFTLIQRVAAAQSLAERAGYIVGAALGSVSGLYLSTEYLL